jgi:hypothetical protein
MDAPDLSDAEFLTEVRKRLQAAVDAGRINAAILEQLLVEAQQYLPSKLTE